MNRQAALKHLLREEEAGAVLVSSRSHIRWLTGFSGSSGIVLATGTSQTLITDGRYSSQAAQETSDVRICIADADPYDYLLKEIVVEGQVRLLVQPEHITASQLERLRGQRPPIDLLLREGLFQRAVARKEPTEINRIKKAQRISTEVFDHLLTWIKPGMKEFEIAAEVVYQHLRRGAERMAFDPIVASGPNSAMPHAKPSDRVVQSNDVLLLDFGCVYHGYACDMSRTLCVGRASSRVKDVHEIVKSAQQLALDAARAGIRALDLDAAARNFIDEQGFGNRFTHSLGHGLGLEIHEWPRISHRNEDRLPIDAVVTIEPGIYLPDEFGVRIEDMVLLKSNGSINLTNTSTNLIEL